MKAFVTLLAVLVMCLGAALIAQDKPSSSPTADFGHRHSGRR
jgi:hypothetical protein